MELFMLPMPPQPKIPSGEIKRLGALGPIYMIGKPLRPIDGDDWMVEITLVETGEKTEYKLTHITTDPKAY